tara:strand:+ start:520 stop:753 length:234 start_codon:yes stop_codon:yes gene_type:complete
MNFPGHFELIKPMGREKEYGFQINWKKPSWSFFACIDLTKRRSKYTIPFFNFEVCEDYGPKLKLGKLHLQFTTWEAA